MHNHRNPILALTFMLFSISASADPIFYVVTFSGQFGAATPGRFGTLDAATGAYQQIGPPTADPLGGLVQLPSGYVGVSFSGNLDSVNPTTGAISIIGSTGLGNLALDTAELNGTVYETDFNQNLYTINVLTGAATLIGPTGIDPAPTDPADLFDEAFFSAGGKLYATWDSFNATTLTLIDDPELYQINPMTGLATLVASTTKQIDGAIELGGTVYAFTATDQVLSLDLATGTTSLVTGYDPAATFITGAAATPEPSFFALVGAGLAALLVFHWRNRHSIHVSPAAQL